MSYWVSLDTNAIIKILNDNHLCKILVDKAIEHRHTICIPNTALQEVLDSKKDSLDKELFQLGKIGSKLKSQFQISRNFSSLTRMEFRAPIYKQPVLSKREIGDIVSTCSSTEKNKRQYFNKVNIRQSKERFKAADREVKGEASRYSFQEVLSIRQNYAGPSPENAFLQIAADWGGNKITLAQLRDFERYKFINIWASFEEYYALGLLLDDKQKAMCREKHIFKTELERGSHHDSIIFSETAFCDVFLTNDPGFTERATRLFEIGIHKVRVQSIQDYFELS